MGLKNIRFISADLTKPDEVFQNLLKNGFQKQKPTVFIAEGISYYIAHNDLTNLMAMFKENNIKQNLILEYFCEKEEVKPSWSQVIEQLIELFSTKFSIPKISLYSENQLQNLATQLDGEILKTVTLHDIEAQKKESSYFSDKKEGHVRISLFEF